MKKEINKVCPCCYCQLEELKKSLSNHVAQTQRYLRDTAFGLSHGSGDSLNDF